jgi:hypothetical protein
LRKYGNENLIRELSCNFAIRIVKLYKYLIYEKKEFVLSKKVLKSGTSIGANVEEALAAKYNLQSQFYYKNFTLRRANRPYHRRINRAGERILSYFAL